MAKTQSAGKSTGKSVPQVLAAPTMAPKPARKVAAGTVEGPKGKKLAETTITEITEEQRHGERRQQEANAVMQFTASNMATPAAHAPALTAEQQKQEEYNKAVAELAIKMGVTPMLEKTKLNRVQRTAINGITRPAIGTETGKVWETADAISAQQHGHAAAIVQLKEHPAMKGVNEHTLKTQYARWRKYNGVKGRLPVIKPVQAEGSYEGVPILK